MDKTGKKLTDRELIDFLVSWYKLDQSSDQLREAVARYLQQNTVLQKAAAVNDRTINPVPSAPTLSDLPHSDLAPSNLTSSDFTPSNVASDLTSSDLVSSELTSSELVPSKPKPPKPPLFDTSKPASYTLQFDPTDEMIGRRGWSIDAWALYYGIEDFFHRVSFGLVTMQTLAILFCIAISAAVMVGAWQSTLSTERQKKATFKSMVIESSEKKRDESPPPELTAATDPTESISPVTEQISETADADSTEKIATDGKPDDEPKNALATSTSIEPPPVNFPGSVFLPALDLIENGLLVEAVENLQSLEKGIRRDLQPLLTLVKVEALVRIRDAESMELARQLLLDCKCGELDTVFDLLVARWMLLSSSEDRQRFLNEAASLPDILRRRMTTWAKVRNGDKELITEVILETNASKGATAVCDNLFIASYHYNLGKYDKTLTELLDTKQKLLGLQNTGKNSVENRLFEAVRSQLASRVEDIFNMVSNVRNRSDIN